MDYSQELPVLFPLSYLHWGGKSVFIVLPSWFPLFDPSLESNNYPTYLYFFSLSPCGLSLCFSVTLFGPLHLADIVNSHSFSSPEVTPWPGYTIRSSLLANTQTRRHTKAVCFFSCAPCFHHFISFSPGTFSSHFSHLTLCYNTSSPWCIMSLCVLRRINSSISIT